MNGALSPLQKRAHSRPVELCHTRRIGDYRVGTLRDAPPPLQVQTKFNTIHGQLDTILAELTKTLPSSGQKEGRRNSMIASYLCMAVKLTVIQRLYDKRRSPQYKILLEPTIWIECHNTTWIKPVLRSLSCVTWLEEFVKRQQLSGMPYISANGPHPLAMKSSPRLASRAPSLAIQNDSPLLSTVCGARARFIMATSDGTIECYSTIGGLIYVDDNLFAMTTAHAFMPHVLESPQLTLIGGMEQISDAPFPTASYSSTWTELSFPTTFAYLDNTYLRGISVDKPIVGASDFALVDPTSFIILSNTYYDTNRKTTETVTSIERTCDLCAGPVWIITSRNKYLDEGYMVEGDASIIVKGVVVSTKMIQVTITPGLGLSGSWVVREGKLLGVVYAGNASSSYLHMLPAERMLDDIMRVLGATVARVATPRDIVNYEAQRTLRERKHEDSRLSTPLPDNHVFGFSQADTSRPSVDPIDTSRLAEDDSNFANLAQSIKKPTLRERYSVAKALIIYWERWDKSEEYTRETDRLKSFFQGLLFETETYTIPAQQSELKLENYVLKQVQEFAQRTRTFQDPSILIIYYVGHGGEDDKKDVTGTGTSQTSRLVWRPFPGSSASVRWYKIQRALDHVMFDVLLLFDSYHLAQVESAREQTVGDSDARMELLAATCNENQTLQRGPGSFTFAIVEIMEDFIRGYNRVEISELHSELLDQKASSYNTPSHVVLRVGPSNRSIILEDLNVLQGYEESNAPPGLGITSEALRIPASESYGEASQLIPRQAIYHSSIPESKELGTPTKPTISSDRLLEQYKQYSEYEDPSVIERLKRRVACLADVLESQKHESFHCLQLHGWKHEPHHRRFVFYFQVPIDYGNESKTLYEAITELKGQSRPTLEERLAMAFHIASAVRNWHGVDWVHQSISSHNIIFLKPSSGSSSDRWDFDRPLLQGFGFAQPMAPSTIERWFENIEFDIYQHPDWHRDPKDSPKREHDLYSLGVVLLDIGLWKSCQSVLGKHRKTMNKGEVPKLLIEAARDDLAYCVGSNYRDAVQTCLTSEFSAKHYDGMEIKLLDAVEEMVLQKLRPKPIL